VNPVRLLAVMTALVLLGACQPQAVNDEQSAEDFYRGKTVTILTGFSPGGGYDDAARVMARFLGKYIPGNPSVIVQNMPGAGGLVAANHLYNSAPADGTMIGLMADTAPLAPLWRPEAARFDSRDITWIGSMGPRGTSMVLVRSDAPATTIEEAKTAVDLIGATGPDSSTSAYALMLNELIGTKFKVILGYAGGSEIMLAMERGEVHGRTGYDWLSLNRDHPNWVRDKFVTVMVQLALKPNPLLPGVPVIVDLVKTEDDRRIVELVFGAGDFSRGFSAPPNLPPKQLAALRQAFKATMEDPEFRAMAGKVIPRLEYAPPEAIEAFVQKAYATPKPILERAAKFVGD